MEHDKATRGRIDSHPILAIPDRETVQFSWNGLMLEACAGEVISSALFAHGIRQFGRHEKDHSAQGLFCANGQCSQCMVIADGIPVKGCMTRVVEGMVLESAEGVPKLPVTREGARCAAPQECETDVLIIGGGPAGLSAALQLGERGVSTLLVDDKDRLGGKLVLQTHKFFGSIDDCYAGTRGVDIGRLLGERIGDHPSVEVWLDSTVLYVFGDRKVGIVRNGRDYRLVSPKVVLNAAGAREKSLAFPGNTLPGVYGAGAFQTLVNRDLVRASERIFVVGGGNVGLIAAYHALQAGIDVAGLVEALPACGGYLVHANKIRRLGVPIMTGHTVLSANGRERVESVTVAEVDARFSPVPGTAKTFPCDTILIAVGLNPVDEFAREAERAGIRVFSAGDAGEIAEASSAMFAGKIAALEIARELGLEHSPVPTEWYATAALLRSRPGAHEEPDYGAFPTEGVTPVIRCTQEIPCNPCASVCTQGVISIPGDGLLGRPELTGSECVGCNRCLFICPGLAISLVDYRDDPARPLVSLAYEVYNHEVKEGDRIVLTDYEGTVLGEEVVTDTVLNKASRKTQIVKVRVPGRIAARVAGFRIQPAEVSLPAEHTVMAGAADDAVVCRCERVTAGEIRKLIRMGVRDMNQIKALTRAGMGACGGKTCESLIGQLFRAEGVDLDEVASHTLRPVFVETLLGTFAGVDGGGDDRPCAEEFVGGDLTESARL